MKIFVVDLELKNNEGKEVRENSNFFYFLTSYSNTLYSFGVHPSAFLNALLKYCGY